MQSSPKWRCNFLHFYLQLLVFLLCNKQCGHMHSGLIRVTFLGGMTAPKQNRWPKYDLGAFPVCTDTMWNEYGGGEGAEYLGTMIISGG